MTDALQPLPWTAEDAVRPPGDPKADRRSYYLLGHGSHLVDTARFLCGEIVSVRADLVEKYGARSWLTAVEFADGSRGQLDLTIAVRMDWHEGFEVQGEHGAVLGRSFQPWHLRSSEVQCFSARDGCYHRPLAPDGHFFRRQVEGFADSAMLGAPMRGADVYDGLAAVRALAAIAQSARTGETVALADAAGPV
jgi:predicted dehydrogenase